MKEQSGPDSGADVMRGEEDSHSAVAVLNRQRRLPLNLARIQGIAKGCLSRLHVRECEVCVVLVSDRAIQKLNRRYLGRRGPTDVLAFSLGERRGVVGTPWMLGDVVISVETASRQARSLGGSLDEEIDVLVVHGLLHLLGYDHTGSQGEARRMWATQRVLVRMLRREMDERYS
jgi:probable rRNA maturation factor